MKTIVIPTVVNMHKMLCGTLLAVLFLADLASKPALSQDAPAVNPADPASVQTQQQAMPPFASSSACRPYEQAGTRPAKKIKHKHTSELSSSEPQSIDEQETPAPSSRVLKGGTTNASKYEDAMAVECPQPTIPQEHQEDGIKSSCVARFVIEQDGKFTVSLVSSSGSEEVDQTALDTLRRWKFKPAMLDGTPVKSSRKIRIEFVID